VPHQGIISVTPDESRGLAYLSTCSDERPDSTHFVVLDLFKETYVDLMDCRHMYAFIAVDYKGRAYHPILGGDIARYDPETHKLERLKQTIDGRPPSPDSHLADEGAHPINWDISPDRKTLYAQPMSGNILYAYDLAAATDTLPGRSLGPALAGGTNTDCRALCVGPRGTVWCSVTAIPAPSAESELHIVRFRPGTDSTPVDLGRVFVSNPEFTAFKDADGKPLPFHGGFRTLTNGKMVTRHMSLGICEGRDGSLYLLEIQPYTVLKIAPSVLTQRQ
jgi:sugar lactone lactonase YvrE